MPPGHNTSQNPKSFIFQNIVPFALARRNAEGYTSRTLEKCISFTSWQHRPVQTDKARLLNTGTIFSNMMDVTIYDMPLCSGRFSDVYMGEWKGCPVCFKVVKLSQPMISSKEADRWRQLHHPNVLPFYGIYQNNKQISLATPWMKNGNITEYLKRNHTSNRVRFVDDVARGLKYLHENGIVHGDLKGKNVLVSEDGRAVLADFGTSSILDYNTLVGVSPPPSVSQEGTARWRAPETFNFEGDEELPDTTASDVYAFAMVVYEIFANQVPFSQFKIDISIMRAVVEGERPPRPPANSASWTVWGLSEHMWSLMEGCWVTQPEERPTMQDVVDRLGPFDNEERLDPLD